MENSLGRGKDNKGDLLSICNIAMKSRLFNPNVCTILLLLLLLNSLTLPIGSCSCERSFSALRRLKTWCHCSMNDERLDSLALGYIHHERTPSHEYILQTWDGSGHRRIALAFQNPKIRTNCNANILK